MILFGLETEYGITVEDSPSLDVVAESIALVKQAGIPGVRMRWDYSQEDPHLDARGFRVSSLRQDIDESDYRDQDSRRELSFQEVKCDLALGNGGRFYNDHAHPEYCTPECSTLDELALQDRAGDRLVMQCAESLTHLRGRRVKIYKNNTDFSGHSYGCHENYLLPRNLPWSSLAQSMTPFLVTRQIFSGAGKFAIESEDRFERHGFQISQRSDFFSELQSVDTMQHRPIINTRDEPHARADRYRRFHVILGDSNLSPFATRLKVGTTALVLEALVRHPKLSVPCLRNPIATLQAISRDEQFQWECGLEDGSVQSAISIQFNFVKAVEKYCDLQADWKQWTMDHWIQTLEDLRDAPDSCDDRLDWVVKRKWIREFQSAQNLAADDPWLRSLDLAYHLLDEEEGLYLGWERAGGMRSIPDPDLVSQAMVKPPSTTRASIRGACIQKFGQYVESAQWDHVTLRSSRGPVRISLLDLFKPPDIVRHQDLLNRAGTVDELSGITETI